MLCFLSHRLLSEQHGVAMTSRCRSSSSSSSGGGGSGSVWFALRVFLPFLHQAPVATWLLPGFPIASSVGRGGMRLPGCWLSLHLSITSRRELDLVPAIFVAE